MTTDAVEARQRAAELQARGVTASLVVPALAVAGGVLGGVAVAAAAWAVAWATARQESRHG